MKSEVHSEPGPSSAAVAPQRVSTMKPSIQQRVEKMQQSMEAYFKLASLGDVALVYRNIGKPGIWSSSFSSSELVKAADNLLVEVPVARPCVLHFIGNLIHENTHLYFSKKETPSLNTDFTKLAEAVSLLIKRLDMLLDEFGTIQFTLELLLPLLQLLVDLGLQNNGRPIMGGKKVGPVQLHDVLSQCSCVADLITLVTKCFEFLLKMGGLTLAIDALHKGLSQAPTLDNWMWLQLATAFPQELLPNLLARGVKELGACFVELQKANGQRPRMLQVQEEYMANFRPLCEFLAYFAEVKKSLTLKSEMQGILERYFDSENDDEDSPLFLVKLFLTNPLLLCFVLDELLRYASPANLLRVIILSSTEKAKLLLMGRPQMAPFVGRVLTQLTLDQLFIVMDCVAPLAFEEYKGLEQLSPAVQHDIKEAVLAIVGIVAPQQRMS